MNTIFWSAKINGIHMLKTYHMALEQMHCVQPPTPKTNLIEIPMADGSIDLSEAVIGHPVYNNRKITMTFGTGREKKRWPTLYSEIQRQFHGKKVQVIFDDDLAFYYVGRASVSDYSRTRELGTLTITVDADPYKYEINDGSEPWLWDPFSFEDGVIREYADIRIQGNGAIVVIGREKYVVPEVITDAPITLSYGGMEFHLEAGHTKLYELPLGPGEHRLEFTGEGTVTVRYRGGIL